MSEHDHARDEPGGSRAGGRRPVIRGVGMTAFTGADGRPLGELLRIAAGRALRDADVSPETVDSVHVGNMAAEAFNERSGLANALVGELGVVGARAHRIENTSASGASAFQDAVMAVRDGPHDAALAVGGEQMSTVDTSTSTEIISRITHEGEYAQGITLPSFAGLAADRYLGVYGATRADLARVAVKNHSNALSNEYAQFNKRITVSDVVESPPVATPLRLYDCCPTGDGAAAVVITSKDASASDIDDVVEVAACESATGTHAVADRADPLAIESVRVAGTRAYETAGFGPGALDVACLHDAFTVLEWLEMEELGLAPDGEAWKRTRDGETAIDGGMPINPGGGLKARGHPLGATGLSQIVELVWQLRGDVPDERAVPGPERGLAVNVAGFGNNSVCTLLEVPA
jgi:acetyl-CoA C-acetyltransferase